MRIGVDASNISSGGGVSHLTQLLAAADPNSDSFSKVIIWTSSNTGSVLGSRPWLDVMCPAELDGPLPRRLLWQQFTLPVALKQQGCDVLFSPGGLIPACGIAARSGAALLPAVTASRNLLPFMSEENRRYKRHPMRLKLRLLKFGQARSFRRATGVIFLTEFARSIVLEMVDNLTARTEIIPHGVDARFYRFPREQKHISKFSLSDPFKLVYISTIDFYKHQWNVAEAVGRLRQKGIPLKISFVGGAYPPALKRLVRTIKDIDPAGEFASYDGNVPFSSIESVYHGADAFVFASTCENMPNILLEAMASGLPIVCSTRPPMRDILGDGGIYMDPLNPHDIQNSLEALVDSVDLRERCAAFAYYRAKYYTWRNCARATFAFIRTIQKQQPIQDDLCVV